MLSAQLFRSAFKSRDTSSAIIITVALGVAALTTAFGLADAAIWRQPPLPDAARIVMINSTHRAPSQPLRRSRWSYRRLQLLRQSASSVVDLANYTPITLTLTQPDEPVRVNGEIVSPDSFRCCKPAP